MPALFAVGLVGFLAVVEGLDGDGVQVEGQSALGCDGAWLEGLGVRCLCAGEAQRGKESVVEDSHGGERRLLRMIVIIDRLRGRQWTVASWCRFSQCKVKNRVNRCNVTVREGMAQFMHKV